MAALAPAVNHATLLQAVEARIQELTQQKNSSAVQIAELEREAKSLRSGTFTFGTGAGAAPAKAHTKKKRTISAAARRNMCLAQKRRHAAEASANKKK